MKSLKERRLGGLIRLRSIHLGSDYGELINQSNAQVLIKRRRQPAGEERRSFLGLRYFPDSDPKLGSILAGSAKLFVVVTASHRRVCAKGDASLLFDGSSSILIRWRTRERRAIPA